MIRIYTILRLNLLCFLLIASSVPAIAQNVVFSVIAATNKMGIEDQIQVQYTIQNVKDLQSIGPTQALLKDFNVVQGPFQQQSTQLFSSNGKHVMSQNFTITYILQPKRTGNLTIPPGMAKDASGHTYQSNSLTIQVIQGSVIAHQQQQQQSADPFGDDPFPDPFAALMQQRNRQLQALRQQQAQQQQAQQSLKSASQSDLKDDLFIRVTVDKNSVHVGEQVTASYKLYARVPMNVSISKLPSLNGFWTQDFIMPRGPMKPAEEVINGKKYQVFTLKKSALFPQQAGTLELDPAEAEGVARVVQKIQQPNPAGGFFDDPFFQSAFGSLMMSDPFFNDDFFGRMAYKDIKVHLKSVPVKINVTPLPEDKKPAGFGNAVGQFTVSGSIDKDQLTTDDVLNLKLVITGSGNLKLIEAPKPVLPNGLTTFEPQIIDTITGRTTTISGSKIITYNITPNNPGDYEIPAIPFSYFDPQINQYVTTQVGPFKVHIKKGKHYRSGAPHIALADIHNINTTNNTDGFNSKPVFYSAGYWSAFALPLLLFIGIAAWKRRDDELSKNTVLLKNKRANKVALKRLATAQKLLHQNNARPFYDEISKAVWLYLSDKLNIPLSSLSRESAQEEMTKRKVPFQLQLQAERVIEECEAALYAGNTGTQQMAYTYREAVDIISKLEESFNA